MADTDRCFCTNRIPLLGYLWKVRCNTYLLPHMTVCPHCGANVSPLPQPRTPIGVENGFWNIPASMPLLTPGPRPKPLPRPKKTLPSESWDRKYLGLARYVATEWSKDPSTKVAAIVVNWEYMQEFIGYNGFPVGVNDSPERYADRELKYQLVVHAESNAIRKAVAARMAKGSTLYVYPSFSFPPICNECVKDAIQSGIKEIVGYEPDLNDPRVKRWLESIKISRMMCEEAGVTWRSLKEPQY